MRIRKYQPEDRQAVVDFALRAWAPVFVSIEASLPADIYRTFFPDWRSCQRDAVIEACENPQHQVHVCELDDRPVGFVVGTLRSPQLGEIYMIAVDPDHHRKGIARRLTQAALAELKAAGASIAMVETGADPGHAPARHTYEACGFTLNPVARYFKSL